MSPPSADERGPRPRAPLAVSPRVAAAVRTHARETWPAECCGLLVGTATRIVRAVRARNRAGDPHRFEIEPADHFAAIREARADGLTVVGAYHSHPRGEPVPSETDLAQLDDPSAVMLIVSRDGRMGAFVVAAGRAVPVELVEVDRDGG